MIDISNMILTDIGYQVTAEDNTREKFVVFSKQINNNQSIQLWFYKHPNMTVTLYDIYKKDKRYNTIDEHIELDKEELIACYNTCLYLEEATKGKTSFNEAYKIFMKKEK